MSEQQCQLHHNFLYMAQKLTRSTLTSNFNFKAKVTIYRVVKDNLKSG